MTAATIVVCTRDRPDLLVRSLRSIAICVDADHRADVIVVMQGSGGAVDALGAAGLDAHVIHDDGVGAARARNLGARHATGGIVLFTDDDCEVPPSWVSDHLATLDDQRLGASFGGVDGLSGPGGAAATTDAAAIPASHRRGAMPWFVGHSANMAVRRHVLLGVGGFDERLGPGSRWKLIGEDADLIVRLLEAGHTLRSGVGAPVRHAEWRSPQEHRRTGARYERGSGAWIGKALRGTGRQAMPYLKWRLGHLRGRIRDDIVIRHDPRGAVSAVLGFTFGLARGLRMEPWPARAPRGDGADERGRASEQPGSEETTP
jgi:GT2 family glycosyltransferase